ncbi:SAM-dependent methyltransferase [Actinomadura hibisca]|uniref:SAM-dependent methyltransferase n=1 Tax=Actinomadura hibisca TaxID=68565 RepID=UPI0008349D75|nr:SAM-dependent methyltransferase [Actinomadura hibisca]
MPARHPAGHGVPAPHAARMWNYWMGGRDNYASDRAAGDAVAGVYPGIVAMAKQSRRFLIRTVRHAARAGVRQFLDIGTGLPTAQNTHQIAQGVAPESRVVYVDNDDLVLAHARALMAATSPEGRTAFLQADYHDPVRIFAEAARVLDFSEPVAVMFMGVLGYEADHGAVRSIVRRTMAAAPSGSLLVLWDGTATCEAVVRGGRRLVEAGGAPYHLRTPEQLADYFTGLEMLDPGLVPLPRWRPDEGDADEPVDAYGAVARKIFRG